MAEAERPDTGDEGEEIQALADDDDLGDLEPTPGESTDVKGGARGCHALDG